jgi:hypothetical protein
VAGTWTAVSLDSSLDRNYRTDALVGTATDLWIAGAHAPSGSIVPWLYHSDGTTVTPIDAPEYVSDVQRIGGALLARGGTRRVDHGWERTGGRWMLRPDLDPLVVFARETLPMYAETTASSGLRWAANGSIVLRHDP